MTQKPKEDAKDKPPFLDRQAWIDAAVDSLKKEGIDKVRVLSLAEKLGVTRGSFYWHFKKRQDLLDELLAHWEKRNTNPILEAARDPVDDFADRFERFSKCWINQSLFDPELDIAIREWARRDTQVRALVRKNDDIRLEAFIDAFKEVGVPEDMALIRARLLYYVQLGYYMTGVEESQEDRINLTHLYYQAHLGEELHPDRAEALRKNLRDGKA